MPDADYCFTGMCRNNTDSGSLSSGVVDVNLSSSIATTSIRVQTKRGQSTLDSSAVCVAIFR
jgi:hypothetical protein